MIAPNDSGGGKGQPKPGQQSFGFHSELNFRDLSKSGYLVLSRLSENS
jgi:hypothetical protein